MVMKFEGPSTAGVHHDIAPPPVLQKPRMSMEDRLAAKLAQQDVSQEAVVDAAPEAVAESRAEAVVEKTPEETANAEKLEYQKLYAKAMRLKKERAEAEEIRRRLGGVGEMPKYRDFAPQGEEREIPPPIEPANLEGRYPQAAARYRDAA